MSATQPTSSSSDPFWNAPVGLMEMNADYSEWRVNRRWLELMGRTEASDPRAALFETIHPEDQDRVAAEFRASIAENRDFQSEYRFLRPDGTVVWIAGRVAALHDDSGAISGHSGCIADITNRVSLTERLDDQQIFDELLFEHSPIAIQVYNADGSLRRMNAQLRKASGVTGDGAHSVLTSPLTANTPLSDAFHTALTGEVGESGPWTVVHPFSSVLEGVPQQPLTMEHTAFPVRSATGQVTAVIVYGRDMTRRAATQKALERSEARFQEVFEQVSDGVAIFDGENLMFINKAMCDIFLCTPEEAANARLDLLFVDQQQHAAIKDDVQSGEELSHIFRAKRRDRTEFDAAVHFSRLASTGWDNGWVAVVRDVSEREESRRRLETSEATLRSYFDHDPDAMYVFDVDDDGVPLLNFANRSTLARAGATLDESIGRRAPEVLGANLTLRLEQRLLDVVQTGAGTQFESTYDLGSGPETFVTQLNPIIDATTGRMRIIGSTRDITEIRRAQEIAQEHQRLQSLTVLAAGVAHDFNNLLQSMFIGVDLAASMAPEGWPGNEMLQEVRSSATKAAVLAHRMLAFSGGKPVRRNGVNLAEVCTTAMASAPHAGVELSLKIDPASASISTFGDGEQLTQVVDAIVANAIEACEPGVGKVIISVGTVRATEGMLARSPMQEKLPPGEYALIRVTDNGSGMTSDLQKQIFEPFFSTRFMGRGLGLAATLGIVRGHGGSILVETAPGTGTTISVLLPIHGAEERSNGKAA